MSDFELSSDDYGESWRDGYDERERFPDRSLLIKRLEDSGDLEVCMSAPLVSAVGLERVVFKLKSKGKFSGNIAQMIIRNDTHRGRTLLRQCAEGSDSYYFMIETPSTRKTRIEFNKFCKNAGLACGGMVRALKVTRDTRRRIAVIAVLPAHCK